MRSPLDPAAAAPRSLRSATAAVVVVALLTVAGWASTAPATGRSAGTGSGAGTGAGTGSGAASASASAAAPYSARRTATLLAGGDVAFTSDIAAALADGYDPLGSLEGAFARRDLGFFNLESLLAPKTLVGNAARPLAPILRGPPAAAPFIARAGVDVVAVANNHAMDVGAAGLFASLASLRDAGVQTTGGGADSEAAATPVVLERNGLRVGVIAFTTLLNHPAKGAVVLRTKAALLAVRDLESRVDVTVVSVHWGEQWKRENGDQRALARQLVDAGADLIIGHHPHVLQGFELVRGRPVFYSLGNFLWGQQAENVRGTAVVDVELGVNRVHAAGLRCVACARGLGAPRLVPCDQLRFLERQLRGLGASRGVRLESRDGALWLPVR